MMFIGPSNFNPDVLKYSNFYVFMFMYLIIWPHWAWIGCNVCPFVEFAFFVSDIRT